MTDANNNPWVGLASYTYTDACRFFGREKEIETISKSIIDNVVTILYGISGSGKSSLINAGLRPYFEEKHYLPVKIRLDHAGSESYSSQIIAAITAKIDETGGEIDHGPNSLLGRDDISDSDRLWCFLHLSKYWSEGNYPLRPVLFIDQFEEIFTLTTDKTRIQDFFDSLEVIAGDIPSESLLKRLEESGGVAHLRRGHSVNIVLTVREDFLARIEDHAYNSVVLHRNRIGLRRLNGLQALDVIMRPAEGLVPRDTALEILARVNGRPVIDNENALRFTEIDTSILSLFCREIYIRMCADRKECFDHDIIARYGDNIIEDYYERNIGKLPADSQHYLESALLTKGGFRDSVAVEDIPEGTISADEINSLCAERIIHKEVINGTERIEFTHDVLCKVAKKRRDKHLEKKQARSQLILRNCFVTDMLIPAITLFVILISLYQECIISRIFNLSPRGIAAATLFLAAFANETIVRASRYYKDRSTLLPQLIGMAATVLLVGGALWLSGVASSLDLYGNAPDMIAILLLSDLAGIVVSLSFRKKIGIAEMFRRTYRLSVLSDKPEIGRIFYNIFIPAIMLLTLIGGAILFLNWPMLLLTPIAGTYITLRMADSSKPTASYFRKHRKPIAILASLLLGAAVAQYIPYGMTLTVAAMTAAFVYGLVRIIKANRESFSWANSAVAMIIVLIYAMCFSVVWISFGYNIVGFTFSEYSRAWNGRVESQPREVAFLKIKDCDGNYGVANRICRIIIPTQFEAIANTFRYKGYADNMGPQLSGITGLRMHGYSDSTTFIVRKSANARPTFWNPCAPAHLNLDNDFSRHGVAIALHSTDPAVLLPALKHYSANPGKDPDTFRALLCRAIYMSTIEKMVENFLYDHNWSNSDGAITSTLGHAYEIMKNQDVDTAYVNPRFIDDLRSDTTFIRIVAPAYNAITHPNYEEPLTADNYMALIGDWRPDESLLYCLVPAVKPVAAYLNADPRLTSAVLDSLCYLSTDLKPSDKALYELIRGNTDSSIKCLTAALAEYDEPGFELDKYSTLSKLVTAYFINKDYDKAFSTLDTIKGRFCWPDIPRLGVSPARAILNDIDWLKAAGVWTDTVSPQYRELTSQLGGAIEALDGAYLHIDEPNSRLELLYNGTIIPDICKALYNDSADIVAFAPDRRLIITPGGRLLDNGYLQAWLRSEGLYGVITDSTIDFIDSLGTPRISLVKPDLLHPVKADLVFRHGYVAVPGRHGLFGLVDKQGRTVLPYEFTFINNPEYGERFRIYRKGDMYGVIGSDLTVHPAIFDYSDVGNYADGRSTKFVNFLRDNHLQ